MLYSTILALAIVTHDQSALRLAPTDSAPQQAVLWQGDAVELRGSTRDYLKVYDHRRERAGYLKVAQVSPLSTQATAAPELLAVVRFLRETPGAEALGIAYGAAYLQAVPRAELDAEPFDALGAMADRLAHRASSKTNKANDATLAAHLEVAAQYGIIMDSFEVEGTMRVCYDGEMFRHVMTMSSADNSQRARAALGLTREECVNPALGPTARSEFDRRRADILDQVGADGLTEEQSAHLHVRRAGVWATLAFEQSRRGEAPQASAERAMQELTLVHKAELSDDDRLEYSDAALRVGASRWASQRQENHAALLAVRLQPGKPGENCLVLLDSRNDTKSPLIERCTYGTVWAESASTNSTGTALALAVQPLAAWRELWLFRKVSSGWTLDVIPPGTNSTDLGYIEFAGWVPGTNRMLAARELKAEGQFKRRFEIINMDTLAVEQQAFSPEYLAPFMRWQDPRWKRQTVAIR